MGGIEREEHGRVKDDRASEGEECKPRQKKTEKWLEYRVLTFLGHQRDIGRQKWDE